MSRNNEETYNERENLFLENEKLKNEIIKLKLIIENQRIKLDHIEWKVGSTI